MDYLKDNPEHYWFKRKIYGWGWTPATKEGWFCVGIYLGIVIGLVVRTNEAMSIDELWSSLFVPLIIATICLLVISYVKGEPPRWQWGLPKREDHE